MASEVEFGGDSKDPMAETRLDHPSLCIEYDGLLLPKLPPSIMMGRSQLEKTKELKDINLKESDIVLCAYPKCGTHWIWEVVEMLKSGENMFKEEVKETRMLEFIFKDGADNLQSPTVYNSHLPLRMLPRDVIEKKIKCILVFRNPKDVCVSYYHHLLGIKRWNYNGTFTEFNQLFLTQQVPFGSYQDYLLQWRSDIENFPDLPVFELYYEDMKEAPERWIKDLANFLDMSVTEEFCREVADACSFHKMKQSSGSKTGLPTMVNFKEGSSFYRKGETGDWKNHFTVAQSENFDRIWDKRMGNAGYHFKY